MPEAASPAALLQELEILNTRIKTALSQERKTLQLERQEFERSSTQVQYALEEQQWQLEVNTHQFVVERQEWDARNALVDEVSHDQPLLLEADGGEIQTTVRTVTEGRDGSSVLAELVRTQAQAASDGQTVHLLVDRDAATLHYVIGWLRDGEDTLTKMPAAVLHSVESEARFWQMRILAAQVEERLGVTGAAHEGRSAVEWFATQLTQGHAPRLAVCRSLARQLRHWLAGGREPSIGPSRRAIAVTHRDCELPQALLAALEMHTDDMALLLSGLGCWLLLSTSVDGRQGLNRFSDRVEKILGEAEAAVSEEKARAAEISAKRSSLPEHLLHRELADELVAASQPPFRGHVKAGAVDDAIGNVHAEDATEDDATVDGEHDPTGVARAAAETDAAAAETNVVAADVVVVETDANVEAADVVAADTGVQMEAVLAVDMVVVADAALAANVAVLVEADVDAAPEVVADMVALAVVPATQELTQQTPPRVESTPLSSASFMTTADHVSGGPPPLSMVRAPPANQGMEVLAIDLARTVERLHRMMKLSSNFDSQR